MRTLHVEGNTWAHRLPARGKLLGLAAFSVALFLTHDILLLGLAVAVAGAVHLGVGLSPAEAFRRLRPVFVTIVMVALFSLLFNPLREAAVTVLRLTALVLFAATVTATTAVAAFIDETTALARPFERLGLFQAADVGLAIGLVIRFVPEILDRHRAIQEAHAARGLKARWTTTLVPLIILTLRDADTVAAAIDARGIRRH